MRRVHRLWRLAKGLYFFSWDSNETLAYQLERWAERTPENVFLRFADQSYTYREANALINRSAHAYTALDVGAGDVVALVVGNRPEFLWHVFGLHKIGAVAALVNTNLRGKPLAHAIETSSARHVVVGAAYWRAFEEAAHEAGAVSSARAEGRVSIEDAEESAETAASDAPRFSALRQQALDHNPASSGRQRLSELAAYIYTSGTTGFPKAALVRHERLYRAGVTWATVALRLTTGDVVYNCLPFYHSNALLLGVGSVITAGATMALAPKFSRRHFWDDVRRYEATSFMYIGELCRYLVNTPPSPEDRQHRVRTITGNGLQSDVWVELERRFGIERIVEFYGATEGNCITLNVFNVRGSVGPMLPNMALARWDAHAQQIVRGDDGFIVRAKRDEPGLLLGRIRKRVSGFDGYSDPAATEAKIVRDALKPGDAYFDTGDLMRVDSMFHLHFVDRVGDTFRWKGENVSTTEVQAELARLPSVEEASVYGVRVPGAEGRAGMASLVLAEGTEFDPDAFKSYVDERLPRYARPVFVRLASALDVTGTFKLRKVDLQDEAFDPSRMADPLFVRHPEHDAYVPLDRAMYDAIERGQVRL